MSLLVRRVVLGDNVRGDSSPVTNLQTLPPCPLPDRSQLLRASPLTFGTPPPPWLDPVSPPGVLHVQGKRLVEGRGVLLVQVNVVLPAGIAKPHRLHRRRPVQVVKPLRDHPLYHQSGASSASRYP